MGVWDRIKKSISPGDDDDNTYDDEEFFEDDYDVSDGYNDGAMSSNNAPGGYGQQNQVYTPPNTHNYNNYQPPVNNTPAAPPPSTTAVTSIMGGDLASSPEIIIVKPEVITDGKKIADLLMNGKTVVIDFEETNKEVIRKLFDFTAGVVYAIGGKLNRVHERNYIASSPKMRVGYEKKNTERERDRNEMDDRDSPMY